MEELDNNKKRLLDIVLRIPGVIMLELLYMESLTFKNWTLLMDVYNQPTWNFDFFLYIVAWLLVLLPHKLLISFYSFAISCISMLASHYLLQYLLSKTNVIKADDCIVKKEVMGEIPWINTIIGNQEAIETSVTVILAQIALSLLSCKVVNAKPKSLVLFLCPLLPWTSGLFASNVLIDMIHVAYILNIAVVLFYLMPGINILKLRFQWKLLWIKMQLISRVFGWQGIITWLLDVYQIQRLLITCWVLRYMFQLLANIYEGFDFSHIDSGIFENFEIWINHLPFNVSVIALLLFTVAQCLTTTINLFGLVCIVKNSVKLQYFLIRSWLHWSFHDHPPDSVSGPLTGVIDGVTLLIMTLYTDAINVQVESRLILMIYFLYTIASSQFQSIFNIVDPILMTLATAHNGSVWKNLRTVTFALFLLAVSGFLSYISVFMMRSTFWIFIITYNYMNTFSLILGSLAIYCILMVDYLTLRGWTSLDDVMFYIRATCRAVEFCITLCMCGYIMMTLYTEMTSFLGIAMLAVYTYYCIVQRGGKGWKIWVMRRQAANKVKSLPLASKEELEEKEDDLCPICYQAMESDVRIMHCQHLFHENCLKKWFYIQDKCPMCYAEFKSTSQSMPVEKAIEVNEDDGTVETDNHSHNGNDTAQ
ncbi:RING finger protein 145-like [Clavelina lepadiformis]|uniref:RING finger protein 145-like n=1 Tax=Clavelina lepadiformis TaxID=159417 RepID=UPI00404186CE